MQLREMRKRQQMTQAELAQQMGTTQQTIARWESGKTELTVSQLGDLAVVLGCGIPDLLGRNKTESKHRGSPFAVSETGTPYGTLRVTFGKIEYAYPIDEVARNEAMQAMNLLSFINNSSAQRRWMTLRTMDNYILFINPEHLSEVDIVSDDVAMMPRFAPVEFYAALSDPEEPVLSNEFRELFEELYPEQEIDKVRDQLDSLEVVLASTGEVFASSLTEETAVELEGFEMHSNSIPRDTFLMVHEDSDYMAKFVNLSSVALIKVPAERYLRILHDMED